MRFHQLQPVSLWAHSLLQTNVVRNPFLIHLKGFRNMLNDLPISKWLDLRFMICFFRAKWSIPPPTLLAANCFEYWETRGSAEIYVLDSSLSLTWSSILEVGCFGSNSIPITSFFTVTLSNNFLAWIYRWVYILRRQKWHPDKIKF